MFNAITGRGAAKSVQQMEEENAKTGKLDRIIIPRRQVQTSIRRQARGYLRLCLRSRQQADRQTARRTQNKFTIRQIEEENIQCQLHTAQQAASDNGGSEATTLLNSGSEETTLLNSGSEEDNSAEQRKRRNDFC